MDTATLLIVDAILRERSLRGAARISGRPVSSISAALDRFENAVSATLCQRAGTGLVFSLEAGRMAPALSKAALLARALFAEQSDPFASAVQLQALERFVEVAERGSIRQAARALRLGQPQLSRQLAHLEGALGRRLLARGTGGSALSADGDIVRGHVIALLHLWGRISRTSEDRFRRTQATVRLGSIMPLGYESEIARQLAKLTANWISMHPRQPLFVSSTTAEELLRGLKNGSFDLVLLDTERPPEDLEGTLIVTSALAIVGARGTDIAAALRERAIAVPSPRSGLRLCIDHLLETTFDERARDQLNLLEIDSIPVILNLVLHYDFVSVLPLASVASIGPELNCIPLPAGFNMQYWLCWLKSSAGAAAGAAVLEALKRASLAGN
ncbi:LysR family transcriptional regulator [Devosia sp. CAU 1758]